VENISILSGGRQGFYEFVSAINEGGERYQTDVSTLGPAVAIKVLPKALAHNSERLSCFQHELKMLAAINCPNSF
jgi:hypothetical protein